MSNKGSFIHGESKTRLHNTWCGMIDRCNNKKDASYPRYGGRGIKICEEWLNDYRNFAKWARKNGYTDELTIERIDVNGDYCPENCKWATTKEQARNRRTTKWVEWQGRKMSLAEAAEMANLPYKQVHFRIKKGWSLEKALTTPLKHGKSDLHKLCDEKGVNYHTVYSRMSRGWSVERAINTPMLGIGANHTTYA